MMGLGIAMGCPRWSKEVGTKRVVRVGSGWKGSREGVSRDGERL